MAHPITGFNVVEVLLLLSYIIPSYCELSGCSHALASGPTSKRPASHAALSDFV